MHVKTHNQSIKKSWGQSSRDWEWKRRYHTSHRYLHQAWVYTTLLFQPFFWVTNVTKMIRKLQDGTTALVKRTITLLPQFFRQPVWPITATNWGKLSGLESFGHRPTSGKTTSRMHNPTKPATNVIMLERLFGIWKLKIFFLAFIELFCSTWPSRWPVCVLK